MNNRSREHSLYSRRAIWAAVGALAITTLTGSLAALAQSGQSVDASKTAAQLSASKKKATASKKAAKKLTAKSKTGSRAQTSGSGVKISPVRTGRGGRGGSIDFGGFGDDFGGGGVAAGGSGGQGGRGGFGGGFGSGGGLGRLGGSVRFDFHNADIVNVLQFYARMSGTTIVAAPELSGNVTIVSPRSVSTDEAFLILQSVLNARGFTAVQKGDVISIVSFPTAMSLAQEAKPGVSLSSSRDMVVTQVIPVANVDADALAKDLVPLVSKGAQIVGSTGTNSIIVTDTADNVARLQSLIKSLDTGSVNQETHVYQLKTADADAVADKVNTLFKQTTTRGRATPQQVPGQPVFPGQPQSPSGTPAVVAVADERTNSVIVVASTDNQVQVATLIRQLDGAETGVLETRMQKMRYANAIDVANLVNGILTAAHGAGSGGGNSPFQNRIFGGGGFFGGFGGGFGNQGGSATSVTVQSTDPLASLNADPRTNTLIITAAADRIQHIEDLISQVDIAVPTEATTFVVPLKNAQAADVAYALSLAFNTTQSTNANQTNPFANLFGNASTSNGTTHTSINRQPGSNNGLGLSRSLTPHQTSRGQQIPPGPPAPPDDGQITASDPQLSQGTLTQPDLTQTPQYPNTAAQNDAATRAQFGFGGRGGFGGGGGQNSRNQLQTTPTYGPGQAGQYANLLQLQGNVFVTPSPDGDSLIVTTTPGNINAVREIVNQLDVVPRQVMIDVIIAEVTLTKDQKLGLSLTGNFAKLFDKSNTATGIINTPAAGFPNTYDPTQTGGQFSVSAAGYTALLQALESDNKIKVLSTPQVFTRNNQAAEIDVTEEVPYISGQVTGVLTTTVSNNVQYLNVGITLNVTPRITRDGLVTIDVTQEASDLLGYVTLGTGASSVSSPETNDRYTDTSVTAQDGQTIVLGGLMQTQKTTTINKVPLISDLPLIGQFFRSREKQLNQVELVVFLTPHVVRNEDDVRAIVQKRSLNMIGEQPDLGKQAPGVIPGVHTEVHYRQSPLLPPAGTVNPTLQQTPTTGGAASPGPGGAPGTP